MFHIQSHAVAFNKCHCSTSHIIPRILQFFVHYALHVLNNLVDYQGLSWFSVDNFTANLRSNMSSTVQRTVTVLH